MKPLVQPCDGILPVLEGIESAKDRLETVIFRCDLAEVEKALAEALSRGVHVRALITYTNRGGENRRRRRERRLLAGGVAKVQPDGASNASHASAYAHNLAGRPAGVYRKPESAENRTRCAAGSGHHLPRRQNCQPSGDPL